MLKIITYELFNGELLKVNKVFDGDGDTIKRVIKLFPSQREKESYKKDLKEDGRIHVELVYKGQNWNIMMLLEILL